MAFYTYSGNSNSGKRMSWRSMDVYFQIIFTGFCVRLALELGQELSQLLSGVTVRQDNILDDSLVRAKGRVIESRDTLPNNPGQKLDSFFIRPDKPWKPIFIEH